MHGGLFRLFELEGGELAGRELFAAQGSGRLLLRLPQRAVDFGSRRTLLGRVVAGGPQRHNGVMARLRVVLRMRSLLGGRSKPRGLGRSGVEGGFSLIASKATVVKRVALLTEEPAQLGVHFNVLFDFFKD